MLQENNSCKNSVRKVGAIVITPTYKQNYMTNSVGINALDKDNTFY